MNSKHVLLIATIFCLAPGDRVTAQTSPLADVDAALKRMELTQDKLRIEPADLEFFDRQGPRSPLLTGLMFKPFNAMLLPGFLDENLTVNEASEAASRALVSLSRWHGRTVRRDLIGDPLERAR